MYDNVNDMFCIQHFLKVKQRGQLIDLRKMYCHDILASTLNAHREKMIKRARDYMEVEIKGTRKKMMRET